MSLVRVSNGFGELLPYKTYRLDSTGGQTDQVISILSEEDMLDHVTSANPIHPTPVLSTSATLPSGEAGNQFIYVTFSQPLDFDSVLTGAPGQLTNNSLTGSILVSAVDPLTGTTTVLRGRVFVNGETYGDIVDPNLEDEAAPILWRNKWVTLGESGETVVLTLSDGSTPGLGFPGTTGAFAGSHELITPNTVVFVVDTDSDLSTYETFPPGVQIRMEIQTSVRAENNLPLAHSATACTTVGDDTIQPEVLFTPPPISHPIVTPGGGDDDVDPTTDITVRFSEPLQPWTVGSLLSLNVPKLSAAIDIRFGPDTKVVSVPFHVTPASHFDLTTWKLLPAFNFPGEGPAFNECGLYNRVDVDIRAGQILDLAGNTNQLPGNTYFTTGEGPGLVNVPVTPDTIYVGRTGGFPGISVIDLNGFGQTTGNPTYDVDHPAVEGNTNYPNNVNVKFQGSQMRPPLAPGVCTIDGGSAGVFTLTKDSSLNDLVVRSPLISRLEDMALGWSLDVSFNNGPTPFGCQAGGGNLCAATGFKQVTTVIDGSTLSPSALNPNGISVLIDGGPNMVSWGPHPNPPPLIFPPLCVSPYLGSLEPTSVDTLLPPPPFPPPNGPGLTNLLFSGDPFGDPANDVPPSGLLATQSNIVFAGPSMPTPILSYCVNYGLRQQIGHFLYVLDRGRNEVVVLNSNRMTVIDRIVVPDPTSLAMGTNMDLLAVTNQSVGTVTFIDVKPSSSKFHQIVKTTNVGTAPRGIAWEPGNEDILVCNEGDNSLSIISAFSLNVRKTSISNLDHPFEVAITPRQLSFGLLRNVYFAYILNRNGRVSVFESGPNGVNGWGYDDLVGTMTMTFNNPKTIQPDPIDLRSAVWIVHEGRLDQETAQVVGAPDAGALTNVVADTGTPGQIPLSVNSLFIPQLRDIHYGVKVSIGEERLTGVPVGIAFDNLLNFGGITNWVTAFSAGSPVAVNGKSIIRQAGGPRPSNSPRFVFAAVPNPHQGIGGVDVILLDGAFLRFDTNAFQEGIQSIPAPNAAIMMDYFSQ